jgi:hypothetical protein
VLADLPDSPYARNALTTLAANCRRELEQSRIFAEIALISDPLNVNYRETLAEVCFRQGLREEAVELMKKLITEDHRNLLYQRQLSRYRNGALNSPKLERADE